MILRKSFVAVVFVVFCCSWADLCSKIACEVLFSPEGRPTERLIAEINKADREILAAIYYLSDIRIAQALILAKQRGVKVEIITDRETASSSFSKAQFLRVNQIPVFVPPLKCSAQPGKTARQPLMHNKFALINEKVFTGSFNWTVSANLFNQENLIIINDESVYETFIQRFRLLRRVCVPLEPPSFTKAESLGDAQVSAGQALMYVIRFLVQGSVPDAQCLQQEVSDTSTQLHHT